MAEINIGRITPNPDTRMGRMLSGGYLTATMRSKKSGQHITVTFKAKDKTQEWKRVPLTEATHLFITLGDGEFGATKVGTYYPRTGKLYPNNPSDAAWIYAAEHILRAAQSGEQETAIFEIQEAERCGVCGLKLTDPESIARGIGPTCLGKLTGSEHYKSTQRKLFTGRNDRRNVPTLSV